MKTRLWLTLFLALIIVESVFAQAGNKKPRELADYMPRTLKELAEVNSKKTETVKNDVMIQNDIVPSRVRVIYEANSRRLGQSQKDVISEWAGRFAGAPEFYTRPYESEALFSEDGEKYWLAVRKEFLPRFEQELKKGDAADLFVIKLGSVRNEGKWQPVLLVEKFVKP